MGLLDVLNSEQGRMALGLLAAAGPSRQPMNVGQRLGGLFEQMDQRKASEQERAQRAQMQQAQMQMMQMQLGEHQAQAAQRAKAEQQAMTDADVMRQSFAPQQGPTPDGSPLMPNRLDPRFMIGRGASMPAVSQAMQLDSMLNPRAKPADFKVVGGSLVRIGGDGQVAEAYRQPDAPEKTPDALRTLELIHGKGSPAYLRAAQQLGAKMTTHQPGTSVSVNTGQKGLDNTLKLRGDFRSEPVYKAHQETLSAHSQIKQALAQASPAGDLAGATKLMKILDPGSVVRESELGMAMAASGLLDRAQNYATNILAGTKLTPTQRKDFQKLADALYSESVKQYNAKRGEYQGIAERNGLNVPDVLGSEQPMSGKPAQATAGGDDPLGLRGN